MTSATEAIKAEPAGDAERPAGSAAEADTPVASQVAARYFKTALVFLALGSLDLLVLAAKRVAPGFLDGPAVLSYGRLVPVATTLLLYGWLTIALLGALFYIIPRAAGRDLTDRNLPTIALGVLAVAYMGGAIALLLGFTESRRYLEAPLVADLVALAGLLLVARSLIRAGDRDDSPVIWYGSMAVIGMLLAHVVGNWPGLAGYAGALQTAFFRSAYVGLGLAAAAVGVAYFVVPRLTGRPPLRATRLSVLGIWSLGLTWPMTGPAELTFGAAADWLETVGVIFSIVVFLPILVIATDLTRGIRGAWSNVRDRISLRFVMTGLAMVGLYLLFGLLQALRSSSAVVGYTDWVAAREVLLLLGPFTFVIFGLVRVVAPQVMGWRPRRGGLGYRVAVGGLALTLGAMAVSAVQTGFTWAGSANGAEYANSGAGWISTLRPLEGNFMIQLIGFDVLLAGLGLAIWAMVGTTKQQLLQAEPIEAAETEPDLVLPSPPSLAKVRRYSTGFVVLAALIVFVLPSLESAGPTLLAEEERTYRSGELAANGRAVYMREGCMYCHTQQVRPIVTDVGLGPVSVLGDYASETPVLLGVQRYGPDLMHYRERADAETLQDHLRDPQDARPWSIMPGYDHLSEDDISALVTYLVGEE